MQKKSLLIKRASAVMAAAVLTASSIPAVTFAEAPAGETEISLDAAVEELEQAADQIIADLTENTEEAGAAVEEAVAEAGEAAEAVVAEAGAAAEAAVAETGEAAEAAVTEAGAAIAEAALDTVFEGRGFTDVLREHLEKNAAGIVDGYNYYISNVEKSKEGVTATYRVTLDEGARALVSMFASLDISWFDALTINQVQKVADGKMYVKMDAVINGTKIASVDVLMDLRNRQFYVSIPEINEGYISMNFNDLTELAGSTAGADPSALGSEEMVELQDTLFDFLLKLVEDPASVLPDPAVVSGALQTVGNIVLDNIVNIESVPDTFSFGTAEEITLDYTLHEAMFGPEELVGMGKALLQAAMTDENIQGLLSYVSALVPASILDNDGKDLATSVNEMLPGVAAQLEQVEMPESEGNYCDLRLWENAEGEIQGFEGTLYESGNSVGTFTALLPATDTESAAYIAFEAEGMTVEINGNGTVDETGFNGNYTVSFSGLDLLGCDVTGYSYDPAAHTANGSVEIYPLDGIATLMGVDLENEEDSSNFMVGMILGLDLVFDFSQAADMSQTFDIHVSMSGSPLFTISCEAAYGADIEVPAVESLAPIYNVANPEDGEKYEATASFDTILQNLTTAGAGDLINMIMGGGEAAVEGAPAEAAPVEPAPAA